MISIVMSSKSIGEVLQMINAPVKSLGTYIPPGVGPSAYYRPFLRDSSGPGPSPQWLTLYR